MKGLRNWYYTFEKDGNTVKSGKNFETLNLLRTYAKRDMQDSKANYATVYNGNKEIGHLEYQYGSLPVFKPYKQIGHD